MLSQRRRFVMAGRTDLFLGHRKAKRHHVALPSSDVAHGARRSHRRMHRFPGQLLCMARRALRVFGHNSRMLDRPQRATHQ